MDGVLHVVVRGGLITVLLGTSGARGCMLGFALQSTVCCVLCAIARDVRDALDGNNVWVRCGIYGEGVVDVVMGKLCGLNDRPSCMLCDNVVASSTVYILIRSTSDRGVLNTYHSLFCATMNPSCQLRMQPFDHDKPPQMSCINSKMIIAADDRPHAMES